MSVLFASDLDRTLIYSARAAGMPLDRLEPVEFRNSLPISYMTPGALATLIELSMRLWFVPTTSRSMAQYARIGPLAPSRYAIVANGGRILDEGRPDEVWSQRIERLISSTSEPLGTVAGIIEQAAEQPWCRSVGRCDDLYLVVTVDRAAVPVDWLASLVDRLTLRGWKADLQHGKLYVLPDALDKWLAVSHLADRTGAETVVAAGDSCLDVQMLEHADVGLRPGHAEIDAGIVVTPGTHGAGAAEEILAAIEVLIGVVESGSTL